VSASSSVAWWVLVLNSAKVVGTWDERWVATTVAPWCKHCATNSQPIPREAPTTKIVDCSVIGFLALCSSTGASPGRTEIAAGCRGIGGILLLLVVVVVVVVVLLVVVGFVVLVVASLAIVSSEDDEAVTTPVVVRGANRDDEEKGATKGEDAAVVMNRDRWDDDAAVACWNVDTPIQALVVHDDDRRTNTKKKSDRGPAVHVAAVIIVITVAVRTIQGRIFIVFFFIVNKYKYFCKYYRSHRSF